VAALKRHSAELLPETDKHGTAGMFHARSDRGIGNWGHLKVCAPNNANSDKMRTCDHSTERQVSVPAAQHIVRFLGYC
jgi:hypothetical protein